MSLSIRVLASLIMSVAVGVFMFYASIDITNSTADYVKIPFLSHSSRAALFQFFLAAFLCAPIAVIAQRNAAWFGALAAIVGDLLMVYHWLQAPQPRSEFGINYFIVSALYAGVFALSSYMWWAYVFRRRTSSAA